MFGSKLRTLVRVFTAAVAATLVFTASPASAAPTKLTQAQAETQLSAAGVTWSSSGNCTNRSSSNCTSFDQINQSTVTGVISLRNASLCAINITGGSEVGHESGTYSHYNGYKVDFTKYTCLNNYVKNNFTKIANRGSDPQWQAPSGAIYCEEGNHWDVTYY